MPRSACISGMMATEAANDDQLERDFIRQILSSLAGRIGEQRSIRFLELTSFVLFVMISGATAYFFLNQKPQSEPLAPVAAAMLLIVNLIPATTLLVLFGRRLALRRAQIGNIGSKQRLHVRLVGTFSLIAAIPTLLLVIFSSLLFQSGVQFWFSSSARNVLENAGALANGYYEEKRRDVADETTTMAGDLRLYLKQVKRDNPEFLNAYFEQVVNRKLSESAIITISKNGGQQTDAVVVPDDTRPTDRTTKWIAAAQLAVLEKGQKLVVSAKPDRIEATVVLFDSPRTYLYANRKVTVPSFLLGSKAQSVLTDYRAMVSRSRSLQLQFNVTLYFVSLFIIGITVWIALLVADRLVRPVNNLVRAAQDIADGDLSARVIEDPDRSDEVAFLSQSFNRMTERLESQTGNLLTANRQLDDRRIFIEAILESVSAGIVSIDSDGQIQLANKIAEQLLAGTEKTIVGQNFRVVSNALSQIVAENRTQAVVEIGEGAEPLTVAVKIAKRETGTVVTFEDISQQLADQRSAAWSDVARRIAHEIKNPLTPIQLAAERLKRRFGKQIVEGNDVFDQLTSTIVRQVGDLRNIVDEFSSFARMPKPVFRTENLVDIVGHAVFLFEVAHPDIVFTFKHDAAQMELTCDRRQLGQAVTNILKNAVEAVIEQRKLSDMTHGFIGKIEVALASVGERLEIRVQDNGAGLPKDRDRLLEPYVTTRQTGSGLGLAIVKKIVEEHFANIEFSDASPNGALVTISLPVAVVVPFENSTFEKVSV
jgi:two-component system, NtrC family, nitrogen regulation sensor histidine kinase NtrY